MKYVIDCTPNQLALIQELIEKDTDSESPLCIAVSLSRPLSELCEEEAKKTQDIADAIKRAHCKKTEVCEESWDSLNRANEFEHYESMATALRSFGSKS